MILIFVLVVSAVYDAIVAYTLLFTSVMKPPCSAADQGCETEVVAAVVWQERVARVYGELWAESKDDNSASRCVTGWFIATVCTIHVMAAVHEPLLAVVFQTYIMQFLWLGTESYCGIMKFRSVVKCLVPNVVFVFAILASALL